MVWDERDTSEKRTFGKCEHILAYTFVSGFWFNIKGIQFDKNNRIKLKMILKLN